MEGAARLHVSLVPRSHDEVPSLEEVRAHCRQSLASYKIPGTIDVVWSLPRTSFGRLQRSEIQAQAAERMRLYDLEHRLGEYQKRREGETPTAPEIHQV
jgi:acyl-CoA synthetase (AMP-forming)/AMP-acid ligase II